MAEFLFVLLEIFFEALLQVLASLAFDASGRTVSRFLRLRTVNLFLACVLYGLLGAAAGAISIALLPNAVFGPGRFRGISLILAPVITGLFMSSTGAVLLRRNKNVTPIETFGGGFALGFGMALVRFIAVSP